MFDFEPFMFICYEAYKSNSYAGGLYPTPANSAAWYYSMLWTKVQPWVKISVPDYVCSNKITTSNKTISWYHDKNAGNYSADGQLNKLNSTYNWICFGK